MSRKPSKYRMVTAEAKRPLGPGLAVRDGDTTKPRLELISPFAEERLGHWLRMGAAKYDVRNWEKGMPFSRCIASLKRHVMAFQQGEDEEDHLAAVMFNAMALVHFQEMIRRGVLPANLNDMPSYRRKAKKRRSR